MPLPQWLPCLQKNPLGRVSNAVYSDDERVAWKLTERCADHDLHGDLGRRVNGVVGVGLVSRVHATIEGNARGVESGLGGGVVLAQEGEDDGIALGSRELRGVKGKTLGTTDSDAVSSTSGADGAGSAGSDGRVGLDVPTSDGSSSGSLSTTSNGLRYCDGSGLVEDSGSGTTTAVNPENVDLNTGTRAQAKSFELVEELGRCLNAVRLRDTRELLEVSVTGLDQVASPPRIDLLNRFSKHRGG